MTTAVQMVNPPKKSFLIKSRVGTVKTTTFTLPTDPNFAYGRPANKDAEGCGESK